MDPAELEQLERLLAALRETEIPPATERRLVEAFGRRWPARPAESWDRLPRPDDRSGAGVGLAFAGEIGPR